MPPVTRPPRDNIVRASRPGIELRSAVDGSLGTLSGHFSIFDSWYEVDSMWEGNFLERVAPGAFKKTFSENRDAMRVTFNHGQDPQLGDKVLGPIDKLEEDSTGAYYEVPLLDTSYNRDLLPGLKAGLYGASFRFRVLKEEFDQEPKASTHNPSALPERTIKEVQVMEFGPVTYPASPTATAAVRSLTDIYAMRQFVRDPERLAQLVDSIRDTALPGAEAEPHSGTEPPDVPPAPPPTEVAVEPVQDPPDGGSLDSQENTDMPPDAIDTPAAVGRAERPARITELRSLTETFATEHTGTLSAELQGSWDSMTAELRSLEAADVADNERRAFIAERAQRPDNIEMPRAMPSFNTPRQRVKDIYSFAEIRAASNGEDDERQLLRDCAMRSVEAAVFPHRNLDQNNARGQVSHLLDYIDSKDRELARRVLQTGSPAYLRAFDKAVKGIRMTPEEERAAALAVVGTTTTGGYSVPYIFDPTIVHTGAYTNINPYRAICRVEQIVGGNNWRGVSAGNVAAQYRAEGAAMTEGGPTFAQPSFTAQRADAFITLSREALADRPDLATELASLIDEGKATNEESQFSIGVGTTVYPAGAFVKSKFTALATITDNVFAVADLDATEAALPIRHRRDAVWMFSRAVIRIIQGWETAYGKLFNSTLGYPAVGNPENNPGGNTGLSLLGYPVWETPSAPVTVTTNDAIVGLLVAPKNYVIVDRVGMEVEIVPNMFDATTGFPTGQRGLMAIWRNTGGVFNADAGRQINIQ